MNETAQPSNYNIGWDVGGWNCDKNPRSRDAIVILDAERRIHGTPWRGNLREKINAANTTDDWIEALFELCGVDHPGERLDVVLAIDTPLGFSAAMLGGMGSFVGAVIGGFVFSFLESFTATFVSGSFKELI